MLSLEEMLAILRKRIIELKKDMSIAELANNCKVPRTTLNGILTDSKRCLNLYSVYRCAEYFNVSIDFLIDRKDIE